jgi:CheY-like chemotaxis protein
MNDGAGRPFEVHRGQERKAAQSANAPLALREHVSPMPKPSPASENPSSPSIKTILLVDDGDETRVTTKWFLSNFGYAVEAARNAEEALALFDPKTHDVVITDNSMPGMTGVEMAHIIKLRAPATPVLMYTGHAPDDRSCLDLVIQRPTHLLALQEALEELLAGRG